MSITATHEVAIATAPLKRHELTTVGQWIVVWSFPTFRPVACGIVIELPYPEPTSGVPAEYSLRIAILDTRTNGGKGRTEEFSAASIGLEPYASSREMDHYKRTYALPRLANPFDVNFIVPPHKPLDMSGTLPIYEFGPGPHSLLDFEDADRIWSLEEIGPY